ncbi:TonB-dependent siderophore receptor [Vibrio nomapromontoriensis]|uniref:TonB-dependent siderophore receptor n=1 Tax=Vibrio nomapromontoriensis TaxID=2910246 RepID=UPI003D137C85
MKLAPTTLCSAVVLALSTSPIYAAEPPANSASSTDETMTIHAQSFDDYKVDSASGAMRTDATMLETPQSVTVIPEIVLDEQLATTLGEALQNDASVSAGTKKWNREVFSLRGFQLDSGSSYLRNGQAQFSHYMLPIETLERVEILKGPSSLLYGQTTPGGLINMVSKKPTYEPMLNVGTDIDHLGSTRIHVDASGPLNESGTIRGRTVLVKQDTVESRQYSNGDNRERDRFLGYGVIEADLADWGLVSVHYERTQDKANIDSGAWLDGDGNTIGGRELIRDMPWAFTDNNIENIGTDLTVYINSSWTAKASYNHQTLTRHRKDSSPRPTSNTIVDGSYEIKPFDRHDDWKLQTFHLDLNGDFDALGVNHRTLFGMNGKLYNYEQYKESSGTTPVIPGQPYPKDPGNDYRKDTTAYRSDNQFYGFYAQDLVTLNDQWQVLLGGRYDLFYKDQQNSDGSIDVKGAHDSQSFSPKAGVIFHPAYNGSIYANYSESFEPQNNVVNGDDSITERVPETSRQYEVGTKWELMDNRLLVTGALFDIEKKNISISETINGSSVTTQGGVQHHRGAEAAAQGQIFDKWFVMTSAMYLDAEYSKHDDYQGNRPVNVPEWSGSAWTRYSMTDNTAFNLGLFYQGDRWADHENTVKMDGYARVDAGASHQIKSGDIRWDFRFNIENLFDKEYLAGAGGSSSNGVITDVHYGDERKFKLSVNATF